MDRSGAIDMAATAARIGFHVGEIVEKKHPTLKVSIADLCDMIAVEADVLEARGEKCGWIAIDYPPECEEAASRIVKEATK